MGTQATKVGFIGLGNMGRPIAANLARAGFALSLYDIDQRRTAALAAEIGGHACTAVRDVGQRAEVVITILPTSKEVASVVADLSPSLAPGALVIEMSSGAPSATRAIASGLAAQNVAMVDAPVSGGVSRAKTGTLAIMVGGADDDVARAEPLLNAMGSVIHKVGPLGAGQAMKALNNLVSAGGFLIGIEALLVGQRFGLDPERMVEVLNASTGANNSTDKKFRQFVLSRSFDSGFGLDLMLKDLGIAIDLARDTATATPFSALCRELAQAAAALVGPGQDHTQFARISEALAGTTLTPRAQKS